MAKRKKPNIKVIVKNPEAIPIIRDRLTLLLIELMEKGTVKNSKIK